MSRRSLMSIGARILGGLALGGGVVAIGARKAGGKQLWQIDPYKCIQCSKCATECVLEPSAVKCAHLHGLCGYCDRCFGYFDLTRNTFNTAAENQICPTDAIRRKHIEGVYYEYKIDADLCIGCAKCVKGCNAYGNRSLFLQIDQDLCVHCNQCAIAMVCPSEAISRMAPDKPYQLKTKIRTD